jgi:hypothetical protein
LINFFKQRNLYIIRVEKTQIHGGSIRIHVSKNPVLVDETLSEILEEEYKSGIFEFENLFHLIEISELFFQAFHLLDTLVLSYLA